ncbi:acyl-CoA dehydrogenase family protein [Cryptosporangium sp. NPDC051539]|uniref:acyl-CoA dehydrogenase family protein n=1 Tax=Cryptosporangium sp. NPDC051539 TaxID=3363962 RepID=UPI0037B59D25
MDFALDEEQRTLQSVLREFFADRSPEAAVRAQMAEPAGFDRQLWKRMSTELGLPGLAIPEEYGGSGFSFVELGVVLEEMGRALVVSPFLGSCVMAAQLALAVGATDLLPGIASGETIAAVGLAEDGGSWRLEDVTTTAADGLVRGHKSFVLDGHGADLYLVVARTPDGPAVFAVDGNAPGLTSEPLHTLDQTRRLARLTFDDAPARLLARPEPTAAAVETMLDRTAVALAADALGGTGQVLDMAVDYAKVREQFGRPIGSFQAIKHKCASMLVELESSRAAAYYALWATAVGHDEASIVAPLVKAHCIDAYLFAAGENIQIHGGIGFTWEHPAHLYLKRAKSSQALLGSSDHHRQVLADRINL